MASYTRSLDVADGIRDSSVSIVLLCAGKSTRMGHERRHKLLSEFDGVPLVRRSARVACNSRASTVFAVTGHRRPEIEAALGGLDLALVSNPQFASGIASSIIAGWTAAHAAAFHGCLIMLADMPGISTSDLDRLMETFKDAEGRAIVRAAGHGKQGNPVILPRFLHSAVLALRADIGARHIIQRSTCPIIEVDIGEGAHIDVDTPEGVIAAGGVLKE